ncbi:protein DETOXIFICATION 35-like [Humulus lupulus]|uniref:protein DETOXIFICATION 35-like n=1 Tax=Humulus lupulus TaxID=3486 RepID=UPI002B402A4F|nr:protein DETOXIFICATION 35-like [Humulus lupulus]
MDEPLLETLTSEIVNGNYASPPLLNEDYLPARSVKELKTVFWLESLKLWRIAGPAVITILCQYGTNSATSIFVGHLGDIELSAISISLGVISSFSFGFLLGMGSALETLCGQAFGAGQVHMLGVYMQRSWIILFTFCLLLTPLYVVAGPLLKLLGQNDQIADLAGQFSIQIIPQLFSLALNFPAQKFLQAQSKFDVLAWISFVVLICHVGLLWLFIYGLSLGTMGAAFALDITAWATCLAQIVYIMVWCNEGWTGFSLMAFKDIWAFVKLSFASALMLCLEIWYMMSIYLITGSLENAVIAVGSLSICLNLNGWEGILFVGVNAAISVRVSNELGRKRPRAAKYSVYVTIFQAILIGIFFMMVVLVAREYLALIFTNDAALRKSVSHLAYLLGVTMLLNSVQQVISGVAIGGGWQSTVAYVNLGSYYIFGIPLGYVLGHFAGFGVMGLWGGMIIGIALQTLILSIILYRTNWTKEVEQSTERVRVWGGQDTNNKATNDPI